MNLQQGSGEYNLWISVIMQVYQDIKFLYGIAGAQKRRHGNLHESTKRDIIQLFKEVSDKHFEDICAYVGISPHKIRLVIYNMMKDYNLEDKDLYLKGFPQHENN